MFPLWQDVEALALIADAQSFILMLDLAARGIMVVVSTENTGSTGNAEANLFPQTSGAEYSAILKIFQTDPEEMLQV